MKRRRLLQAVQIAVLTLSDRSRGGPVVFPLQLPRLMLPVLTAALALIWTVDEALYTAWTAARLMMVWTADYAADWAASLRLMWTAVKGPWKWREIFYGASEA